MDADVLMTFRLCVIGKTAPNYKLINYSNKEGQVACVSSALVPVQLVGSLSHVYDAISRKGLRIDPVVIWPACLAVAHGVRFCPSVLN